MLVLCSSVTHSFYIRIPPITSPNYGAILQQYGYGIAHIPSHFGTYGMQYFPPLNLWAAHSYLPSAHFLKEVYLHPIDVHRAPEQTYITNNIFNNFFPQTYLPTTSSMLEYPGWNFAKKTQNKEISNEQNTPTQNKELTNEQNTSNAHMLPLGTMRVEDAEGAGEQSVNYSYSKEQPYAYGLR